jgi:hypothetical protein
MDTPKVRLPSPLLTHGMNDGALSAVAVPPIAGMMPGSMPGTCSVMLQAYDNNNNNNFCSESNNETVFPTLL